MFKDLFCEDLLIIQYILKNKIKAIIFIFAIRFGFIAKKFMKIIYKKLGI